MNLDKILRILTNFKQRIEDLEKVRSITNLTIPDTGKFQVDKRASDPAASNGRIYYNTTTHKLKVCENGVWKTITTS